MGTYFSTVAGPAGPSDYVEQNSVWTGWWDVSNGYVNEGLFQ